MGRRTALTFEPSDPRTLEPSNLRTLPDASSSPRLGCAAEPGLDHGRASAAERVPGRACGVLDAGQQGQRARVNPAAVALEVVGRGGQRRALLGPAAHGVDRADFPLEDLHVVQRAEPALRALQPIDERGRVEHRRGRRELEHVPQLLDRDAQRVQALGRVHRPARVRRGEHRVGAVDDARRERGVPGPIVRRAGHARGERLDIGGDARAIVAAHLAGEPRSAPFAFALEPALDDGREGRRPAVPARRTRELDERDVDLARRSERARDVADAPREARGVAAGIGRVGDRERLAEAPRRDAAAMNGVGMAGARAGETPRERAVLARDRGRQAARDRRGTMAHRVLISFVTPSLHASHVRIAAIDIGTNSLHMIVCRVRPDLSFDVVDREKDMVRLGAGGLDGRELSGPSMAAAIQTLSKFTRIAASHGVDEIIATATSAVREAVNGADFVNAVHRDVGLRVRVISGAEEARLIHLAASHSTRIGRRPAVVVDIGGGSTEISVGTAERMQAARSFKLGVIRLTERFVTTDPISDEDRRRLVRHIRMVLRPALAQVVRRPIDQVIGTSGTILSLGALASDKRPSDDVRNLRVSAAALRRLARRLTSLTLEERLRLPNMDPRRADLAPAGALLLDAILDGLGADAITLSDFALREGLVLDYIRRNVRHIRTIDRYPDLRRRSVVELAERCNYFAPHAEQVARLSLAIFDQTAARHRLGQREREWLEYGALLHDIGAHISYERHHKHSYYLIRHGGLRGFEPEDVTIIGLVARYHRQATPKASHDGYGSLSKPRRRAVRLLGAIVRMAEGLDRSHAQVVSGLQVAGRGRRLTLRLTVTGDAELELWAAERHQTALADELGCAIRCEIARGRAATARKDASTDARHPRHAAHPPRTPLRGGRHRRVGQDDAAEPAVEVADGQRPSRVRHGVELVGAREGSDEGGQEEERAHADDVQPAARDRLRRSAAV